MPSNYETFFDAERFAVVGDSAQTPFPILSYRGLKRLGKTVFPVDRSTDRIDGDQAFASLDALSESPQAVIIEVPKQETGAWVAQAAAVGAADVWIHMGLETGDATALAAEKGINLRTGTCAVMYLSRGFSYHGIHKAIMKPLGKY